VFEGRSILKNCPLVVPQGHEGCRTVEACLRIVKAFSQPFIFIEESERNLRVRACEAAGLNPQVLLLLAS
jgi:hypothetical protein